MTKDKNGKGCLMVRWLNIDMVVVTGKKGEMFLLDTTQLYHVLDKLSLRQEALDLYGEES